MTEKEVLLKLVQIGDIIKDSYNLSFIVRKIPYDNIFYLQSMVHYRAGYPSTNNITNSDDFTVINGELIYKTL